MGKHSICFVYLHRMSWDYDVISWVTFGHSSAAAVCGHSNKNNGFWNWNPDFNWPHLKLEAALFILFVFTSENEVVAEEEEDAQ